MAKTTGTNRPSLKKKKPPTKKRPAPKKKPLTLDQRAAASAQAQVAPQLGELDIASRDAASKHATRIQQQEGWYGGFSDQLNRSFQNTTSALNNLIGLNNQGGAQNQQILQAALNSGQAPVTAAANQLGGNRPPSAQAGVLASALANSDASRNVVGQNALGLQAAQGARLALAPIGRIQSGMAENARYGAQDTEIQNQRRGVTSQIGSLTEKAKTELENQQFQRYLAEQELGLKKKDQTFQQWLAGEQLDLEGRKFKAQTEIDWANVAVNQRQVEAQLANISRDEAKAKTGEEKERAKLRGEQWNRGLELLAGFLKPGDNEAAIGDEDPQDDPNTDVDESQKAKYRRTYSDAFRLLTGQARMSRSDALRLLATSDFASWRQRARKELNNLKRRGKRRSPTIGDLAGKPNSMSKRPPAGSNLKRK
jgi:hypothetical protein